MSKKSVLESHPELRLPLIGVIAWIVPGLGHLLIGERKRGAILMVTIALTFWIGVVVGGLRSSVDPATRKWWFVGQLCAGSHTLVTYGIGQAMSRGDSISDPAQLAYGRGEEVAVIYTAIAGMLNVLVILDVLARTERRYVLGDPASAGASGKVK